MKKFILGLTLIISALGFSERLHTDGKWHEKEIVGEYKGMLEIKMEKGELILYSNWDLKAKKLARFVKVKNGLYRVEYYNKSEDPKTAVYTAWDTKYKTIVDLDKNLNIVYDNYEKFK